MANNVRTPARILILEDQESDARLLVAELRSAGIDFEWTRAGTEAEYRLQLQSLPEIVLSDFSLPQFDGLRALEVLREIGPDVPFILVSGQIGEEAAVEAMRRGATDYLLKDRLGRLGQAVSQALEQTQLRCAKRQAEQLLQASREAERQAAAMTHAIVNALPAHIALLDADGLTIAANDAWIRFGGANSFHEAVPGIGSNYVDICLQARGDDADKAIAAGQGIREVLAAARPDFSLEFRCVSGTGRHWFRMMVAPLRIGQAGGAVVMHIDITDRRDALELLRQSEERYRTLLARIPEPLFVYDAETLQFLSVNDAAVTGYGYSNDEFLELRLLDLCHPDDVPALLAARGAGPSTDEEGGVWRHRRKSGAVFEAEVTTHTVTLGGRPARIVLAKDVTEKRRAAEALAESQAKLATAVRLAHMGYWSRDLRTGEVYWSDELFEIFHLDRKRFGGDHEAFLATVHPDDRAMVRDRVASAVAQGEGFEVTYRIVAGGEIRVIFEVGQFIKAADGTPLRISGTAQDVTERVRSEEALRLRDRAIQAVTQGIIITDPNLPDNPVIYANSGFETLTRYRAEDIVGRNCRILQGKDTDPEAVARLRKAIAEGGACRVELINYRRDGTPFWNELVISPVRDDTGRLTHFVGSQSDVTERRRLEEQFRQAQKMDAFGQLAGGVAHDFNNLLTVINGYSEMLLEGLPQDDPSRELVQSIGKAGQRSAALTRQLLAFSRQQILAPRVLDLNEVASGAARMLHRVIGEDVRLTTRLARGLRAVRADPGQLEQLLMNLAVNARDAMPTGGELRIETSNVDLDEEHVRAHPEAQPGPHVLLSVSDTGSGMRPEVQARIFEPFFTTKGAGKGTGLGLATVYGIIRQSGGHIAVHSEVGRGTTFSIYLPQSEGVVHDAESGALARRAPRGSETVLVVEDESDVRALTRRVLASCGYTVLEAKDGTEALQLATTHHGPIHLLVSDVVMPGMSGAAVAQQLSQDHPEMRVLFVSGYTDDAVLRHGVLQEEVNFLQKPFSPFALAQKVRELLDAPAPAPVQAGG